MKIRFLVLTLIFFIVLGCKKQENEIVISKSCEDNLKKCEKLKDSAYNKINNDFYKTFGLEVNLENQQTIKIDNTIQHKRYRAFGSISNNLLDINIPVSDGDLGIDSCYNLSNHKFNVLVVVLNKPNSDGSGTKCEPTHIINHKFNVNEIGFSDNLKKVFIISIYSNNFNNSHMRKYLSDISKCNDYMALKELINDIHCEAIRPDEDGGDIIP